MHRLFLRTLKTGLAAALLLGTSLAAQAAGQWQVVGSAGFTAAQAEYISLAFGPGGTPYVAYSDWNKNHKATVMRLKGDEKGWEVVGGAGFSADVALFTSLAFGPGGEPYVAYSDKANGHKVTVMRLNANGLGWETLGAAGFSQNSSSYISLAFNLANSYDETPYVAYQGFSNKATVMHPWQRDDEYIWDTVGPTGFSAGGVAFTSLAFGPGSRPYVAFQDRANGNKATVMRRNDGGWGWDVVGTPGFSAGYTNSTTLVFSPSGVPYVGYQDGGYDYKAVVKRLNADGTAWESVGAPGQGNGQANEPTIAFSTDGALYLASVERGFGSAVLRRYDSTTNTWKYLGDTGVPTGHVALAVSSDGRPYVAFTQVADGKITVMAWVNAPDAPTGLAAYAGYGQVALQWSAPAFDGGASVLNYVAKASPGGISCQTVGTGCTISGLIAGLTYTFTVSARNDMGYSAPSSSVQAAPFSVPQAPTDLTASAGTQQATLQWAVAPDGGKPVLDYTATASPGGNSCTATAPALTCTITGLTPGQTYSFTVSARNVLGTGAVSGAATASIPNVPHAPTALTAMAGNQQVALQWDEAALDSGSPVVLDYTATASPGDVSCTATAPVLGCAITDLTPGQTYSFTVTARNAMGASAPSAAAQAMALGVPDAPATLTVTAGNEQATLQWSAPAFDGGSPVLEYTATASPGGANCTAAASVLSCTITSLAAGQTYSFSVTARNAIGPGATSSAATATPFSSAPVSVPGMTGIGEAVLTGGGAGCTLEPGAGFASVAAPSGWQLPWGAFGFAATGCSGTVSLALTLPEALPVAVQFLKYGPKTPANDSAVAPSEWFAWSAASLSADRRTVRWSLTDNGVGDGDGALGSLRDPLAPAVAAVVTPIPTVSVWALALLALALGGLALRGRGRRA